MQCQYAGHRLMEQIEKVLFPYGSQSQSYIMIYYNIMNNQGNMYRD